MLKASAARSRRASRRPVVLSPTIHVTVDDGRSVPLDPVILQSSRTEWGAFADSEQLLYEPIEHRFDLVMPRELFQISVAEDLADETWHALRSACQPAVVDGREFRGDATRRPEADELWLAYLIVAELPVHMVEEQRGWTNICDAVGDTLVDVWSICEDLRAGRSAFADIALIDGALLWPRVLGVHPRIRGQEVGLRLLAHGLWALQRSVSDIAVIEAGAVQSRFDSIEPMQTPESYRALCDYYARLGFRRCFPRVPVHKRSGSIMMLALGERGMRAERTSGERL